MNPREPAHGRLGLSAACSSPPVLWLSSAAPAPPSSQGGRGAGAVHPRHPSAPCPLRGSRGRHACGPRTHQGGRDRRAVRSRRGRSAGAAAGDAAVTGRESVRERNRASSAYLQRALHHTTAHGHLAGRTRPPRGLPPASPRTFRTTAVAGTHPCLFPLVPPWLRPVAWGSTAPKKPQNSSSSRDAHTVLDEMALRKTMVSLLLRCSKPTLAYRPPRAAH